MSPASAPLISRYTYRRHAQASLLEGVLAGVLVTSDVVARKSLGASQWQIVLLTMAPPTLCLLAVLFSHRIETVERRRFFLFAGVAGRLSLFLVAGVLGPWSFLGVLGIHGLVQALLVPAQNTIYQSNYDRESRGRLFGRASVLGGLTTAVAALGSGVMLDSDSTAYLWIYPLAGLFGFSACLIFGSIRVRRAQRPGGAEQKAVSGAVPDPSPAMASAPAAASRDPDGGRATAVGVLRETLIRDVGFRRFETAMFIYGLGFMCMQPVFARLFVDELGMDYSDASLAKGVVFYGVHVAALGYAGRLYDKIGLERLQIWACVALLAFSGTLALVSTPAQAITAFSLYGLGMAGVNIVWTMGPVQFAPPGAANRYMGVHVALVGVRAVIGHVLGGAVAEHFGSARAAFVLAAAFFTIAMPLMARSRRPAAAAPSSQSPSC